MSLTRGNLSPQTLAQRLRSSSQMSAARRLWPLVSPVVVPFALLNIVAASQAAGVIRTVWLASALCIVLRSVATYGYFVPVMMRRLKKAESMEPAELARVVRKWTALSPLRLWIKIPAWIAAIRVLTALGSE